MHSFENEYKQFLHFPQATPSTGSKQLTDLAKILAIVVLPVPLGPENK